MNVENLELANRYMLLPTGEGKNFDPIEVGGRGIMLEVAKSISEDQVLAISGMHTELCILIVKLTAEECREIITHAIEKYDRSFRE